jgi:chromosome segregation ATPase
MPDGSDMQTSELTALIQAVARLDVKIENSKEQRAEILSRFDQVRQDIHAIRNKLNEGMAMVHVHENVLGGHQERMNSHSKQLHDHDLALAGANMAIAEARGAKAMAKWAIGLILSGMGLILTYLGLRFGPPI